MPEVSLSARRYAEVLQESRGFTDEEEALFDRGAQRAYEEFRNKAAESRKMTPEQIEEFAQAGTVRALLVLPSAGETAPRLKSSPALCAGPRVDRQESSVGGAGGLPGRPPYSS